MDKNLIIDVGMNNGDDTYYYLKEGFKVVAIDADPLLCVKAGKRFEKEIEDGKLTILNIGINDQAGTFPFYVNETHSDWSSFDFKMGTRNGKYKEIKIDAVTFESILEKYGTPYYLKIDIEGFDGYCVGALNPKDLPQYLSCEGQEISVLNQMYKLGYRKFKIIDQFYAHRELNIDNAKRNTLYFWYYFFRSSFLKRFGHLLKLEFPKDSSGPFGEKTKGSWKSFEEVSDLYNSFFNSATNRKPLNPISWFDFHASL
jgi:FkbM family methyltransferase